MPRAILFGFEGGLVDPVAPRFEALSGVLAEEGVELSAELLEACPFGAPYEDWLARVLAHARAGPPAALAPRLMVRAAASFRAMQRERGPAWLDGAIEFVEHAAGAGLELGAVTRLSRSEVTQALERGGLTTLLKVVVGAEDADESGSGAAGYRLALERMNTQPPLPERLIHPHEVAAVEGTAEGVRSAAAAGLLTVAIGAAGEAGEADLTVSGFDQLDLSRLDSG